MIYQKGNMWKVTGYSNKFATKKEAEDFAGVIPEAHAPVFVEPEPALEKGWSPLDMLRGKKTCEDCGEDPCVCEEEWNSVDEM